MTFTGCLLTLYSIYTSQSSGHDRPSPTTNMDCKVIFLLAGLYTHSVCGSHYHGPLAKPTVLKSGYLADTHDVAAAKEAHLHALAKQPHGYGGDYGYDGDYGYNQDSEHSNTYGGHGDIRYQGPTAIPHVLHDGHIADTHEVAAAKAEHFAAVAKARTQGGYGNDYSGRYGGGYGAGSEAHQEYSHHAVIYHGPLAKPVVLKSGYLADTHEVAAAREHHLHALHNVNHHGNYNYHY